MKKSAYLLAAILLLFAFTNCDQTRKTLHEKYLNYTHGLDSLDEVHQDIASMHSETTKDNNDLQGRLYDLEIADSSALINLKQHQILLKKQDSLLGNMKQYILAHKKAVADTLTEEELETKIEALKLNYDEITKSLNDVEAALKRIDSDQKIIKERIKAIPSLEDH